MNPDRYIADFVKVVGFKVYQVMEEEDFTM